jgi:tetratricopeptide (TPR) repeat protein
LTSLAWVLATTADDGLRDAPRAVEAAQRAVALTDRRHASALDALAAAYASAGQFDRALEAIREALRLAAGTPDEEAMRDRRALYEAGRPYRR